MAAGTITLTNNSDAVSGAGTAFLSELAVGGFIVASVGGISYTMPVTAIASDTALTIINKFTGPTMSGLAWHISTREQQAMITAALVAQSAEALRGLNYDKQNWQAVFSAPGDITVTLPDNSQFTGPSWKKISGMLGEGGFLKAEKNLSDLPDKAKGRVNIGLDRINQGAGFTSISSSPSLDGSVNFIDIREDNTWGAYKAGVGPLALPVSNGGTGVSSLTELKTNMGLGTLASLPDYTILTGPIARESDEGARLVLYSSGYIEFQNKLGYARPLPIQTLPVIGAVSQSGGYPTGSIFEAGINANGTFVKYADGTMICMGGLPDKTAPASQTVEVDVIYPATFNTVNYVAGTYSPTQSTDWFNFIYSYNRFTTSARLVFKNGATSQLINGGQFFAIGRWF